MDTAATVTPIASVEKTVAVEAPPAEVAQTNGAEVVTNGNTTPVTNGGVADAVPEVKPRTVAAEVVSAEPVAAAAAAEVVPTIEAVASVPEPTAVAAEPVVEQVVAEPVTVLATPVVVEPVVEAVVEPVAKLVTEPIVEPIATPVAATPVATPVTAEPAAAPVQAAAAAVADIAVTTPATTTPAAATAGLLSLPEYVQQAIKDVAVREGFLNFETKIEQGQNSGDGFVGEITRARLIGVQTRNGVVYADAELSLIVKLPPSNPMRREFMAMKLFEREVFVYNELLPTFIKFQLEHGLKPGQAGFHSFPKCYYAHFDRTTDQAVLILENLIESGYAMESKLVSVKFEYARTVLEKLAELHAISFAMKQQRPAEFERFKSLIDVMTPDNEQVRTMTQTMMTTSGKQAVTALDASETVLREKVLRAVEAIVDETGRYSGENSEPYSVINHGDCWVNNMMFKHVSGQSRQVSFYDWQCTRYSSPVLDIVYFLYLCTDAPLRARYFDDLIQLYHHSLRAQLDRLNADVNELYPFTAMLRQLKQFGRFALGAAIMVVPMLCTEKTDLPDMDELVEKFGDGTEWDGEVFALSEKTKKKFADRMGGILRDMNKKGYF